jgi:hypothetical protein
MLAVGEREEKGRGNLPFERERERKLPRHTKCPSYIKEASNTDPLDLSLSDVSGVSKWQGTLTLGQLFSKGHTSLPLHGAPEWNADPDC